MSLGLFLAIFNSYPVLTSITGFGNTNNQDAKEKGVDHDNKKQILIFNEGILLKQEKLEVDPALQLLDAKHASVFLRGLRKIASAQSQRVVYIIQDVPEITSQAQEIIRFAKDISEDIHIPLRVQVPLFARQVNNRYGSIDFLHANPDANFLFPLQFFVGLDGLLRQRTGFEKISLMNVKDKRKNALLRNNRQFLEEEIQKNFSNLTLKDYCNSIDNFLNKVKAFKEPDRTSVEKAYEIVKFLRYFKTGESDLLKNVLWTIFCKRPLSDLTRFMTEKITPFTAAVSFLNLKWSVQEALEKYSTIIVHCDDFCGTDLNSYLEQNFFQFLKVPQESREASNHLDPSEIRQVFGQLSETLGGAFELQQCNSCQKFNTEAENYKCCGQCQSCFYCSRECQKTDWPAHKQNCIKKNLNEKIEKEN